MKRILVVLFALALMTAGDAASWAMTAMKSCPGKCPFCP